MKLGTFTGVTTTGELNVTKPISGFIFCSSKNLNDIVDEVVTVQIERTNGNAQIINRQPLRDLLQLSTSGSIVFSYATFATNAIVDLTIDGGGLFLAENERIKLTLDGLNEHETYEVYGEECPFTTHKIYAYEKKVCLIGESVRSIDVSMYDKVLISNMGKVVELRQKFPNGNQTLHTQLELYLNQITSDPVGYITHEGVIQSVVNDGIVMPTELISSYEITKQEAFQVNLLCRKPASIYWTNTGFQNPRPTVPSNTGILSNNPRFTVKAE